MPCNGKTILYCKGLFGVQVAAGLIKMCTMVRDDDEAEWLSTEEFHEIATFSLYKVTGPSSLYDTRTGD